MFVPRPKMEQAKAIAKAAAEAITVGDPNGNSVIGPVVSEVQFNKIQGLIQKGIDERATLVTGGTGRPDGLDKGYFVKPTIFADVTNDMTIAREEIFGPVLAMLPYDSLEQAIEQGNDTPYGLAAYVQGPEAEAREVSRRLRAGQVILNGAAPDFMAPFGTPIYAIADGVVVTSSEGGTGWGVYVKIAHNIGGQDVTTLYAHMLYGSRRVSVGDTVSAGQLIGQVSDTGRAYGTHLHLEVVVNGTYVNGESWLQANAG